MAAGCVPSCPRAFTADRRNHHHGAITTVSIFLLPLPNDDLIDPKQIKGVRCIPGKGMLLTNEFNKVLNLPLEADVDVVKAYITALHKMLQSKTPYEIDWAAIKADVLAKKATQPPRPEAA